MILLLAFFQALTFNGSVSFEGGVEFRPPTALTATDCGTVAQAAWDQFSWQSDPWEVPAASTQSGSGCSVDSEVYPSPSLP